MSTTQTLDFRKLLWQKGEVHELRVPKHNRYAQTASDYFDSPEKLAAAARKWNGTANLYATLNPVEPAPLARAYNRMIERAQKPNSRPGRPVAQLAAYGCRPDPSLRHQQHRQ